MNLHLKMSSRLASFMLALFLLLSGIVYVHANEIVLAVTGEGRAPENEKGSTKGKELAKRAALADAYRKMARKLYGSETLKQGDVLVESVNGLVEGAKITKEECKDGACTVELTLTTKSIVTIYGKTLSKKKGKDKKQDDALENCRNMKTILQSELDNVKSENKQLKKQAGNLKKQVADLNKKLEKQN